MVFSIFKDHRRRQIRSSPFPAGWQNLLQTDVRLFGTLTSSEQDKLKADMHILIVEKHWEGTGAVTVTDRVTVVVAGNAAMLLLGLENEYFDNFDSILVYPHSFTAPIKTIGPGGVVDEVPSGRIGEAWSTGPVILSWPDVVDGSLNDRDGRNVVLHEFAHKLDQQNGSADGVPRLGRHSNSEEWSSVMSREYESLLHDARRGRHTLLDSYGATNAAEFFAVVTECFFEKPKALKKEHSSLYEVFSGYYGQDPAARDYS